MEKLPFFDLVVGGPDMSGTSTQVSDIIHFFKSKGYKVRDMRGSELAALFHAQKFSEINMEHDALYEFLADKSVGEEKKQWFILEATKILESLSYATMQRGDLYEYIDPESADLWVFEEPTKRGAGRVTRITDANISYYEVEHDSKEVATTHSVYRYEEFHRFRKHLIQKGIPLIRSRSEESVCYQIFDGQALPEGVSVEFYMSLRGHKIAFTYPPTHIFTVHADKDMNEQQYLALKEQRSGKRQLDDYEKNVAFQVMVNKRYASGWLEDFYEKECSKLGASQPLIFHFNMLKSKEEIRQEMFSVLNNSLLKSVINKPKAL